MKIVSKATMIVIALVIGTLINGLVFMKTWNWFIVPVYKLPFLLFSQAAGISFFLATLRTTISDNESRNIEEIIVKAILKICAWGAVVLTLGFILNKIIY